MTQFVSFDVETGLILDGTPVPPLVCGSFAEPGKPGIVQPRNEALTTIRRHLNTAYTIVGANIAYDMTVICNEDPELIPLVLTAYREGRVFDVLLAQTLDAIAKGYLTDEGIIDPHGRPLLDVNGRHTNRFSLDICVRQVLGRDDAKANDFFRKRYWYLRNIPMDQWPPVARQYPIDDAVNTMAVAVEQMRTHENLHNMPEQAFFAFAQRLGSITGLRTDADMVKRLIGEAEVELAVAAERFKALGVVRADGSLNTAALKARIIVSHGITRTCVTCGGAGKTPSVKTKKPVACKLCDGTGAALREVCADCNGTGEKCHCTRGSVPTKAARLVQFTDTGGVARGRDALYESGDDILIEYAAGTEKAKVPTTYGPALLAGAKAPLFTPGNAILATGRSSYGGVVQLMPRSGGLRECFIPRAGYYFVSCDYESLELATHAQSCLWLVGFSELANALNAGVKPHDAFGASMIGMDYKEFLTRRAGGEKRLDDIRQASKPPNFGFPGGMGAFKLVLQQRKQGPDTTGPDGRKWRGLRFCLLIGNETECGKEKITEWKGRDYAPACRRCVECAEELRAHWFRQWPENKPYFNWVKQRTNTDHYPLPYVIQHVSKRKRGGVGFTQAANTMFQGLAGDGAKAAFCRVTDECFDPRSALYGSRPLIFVHDEIIAEVPISVASDAAKRLGEIMVNTMREYVPDVVIGAEPCLMTRWYKSASARYNDAGDLIPWQPTARPLKPSETKRLTEGKP